MAPERNGFGQGSGLRDQILLIAVNLTRPSGVYQLKEVNEKELIMKRCRRFWKT
jgi:hypothetical protein